MPADHCGDNLRWKDHKTKQNKTKQKENLHTIKRIGLQAPIPINRFYVGGGVEIQGPDEKMKEGKIRVFLARQLFSTRKKKNSGETLKKVFSTARIYHQDNDLSYHKGNPCEIEPGCQVCDNHRDFSHFWGALRKIFLFIKGGQKKK